MHLIIDFIPSYKNNITYYIIDRQHPTLTCLVHDKFPRCKDRRQQNAKTKHVKRAPDIHTKTTYMQHVYELIVGVIILTTR